MIKYILFWIVSIALILPNTSYAQDELWSAADSLSTCATYTRFVSFVRNGEFRCKRNASRFHNKFSHTISMPGSGIKTCYIGTVDSNFPALKGYSCSIVKYRNKYHSIICIRTLSDNRIESTLDSLPQWQERLYKRAQELRSCSGKSIDMVFASKTLVPLDLWKYYDHEIGVAASTPESLMYLGVGNPTDYWEDSFGSDSPLGLLTYFFGSLDGVLPEPFKDEQIDLGGGIGILLSSGENMLNEVQASLDDAYRNRHILYRQHISFDSISVTAEPLMNENNLERLLGAREMDVRGMFDDAWVDVEVEFDLEEIYVRYEEREAMLEEGLSIHGDRFFGLPDYERLREDFADEAVFFQGTGIPGCRSGVVFLVIVPPLYESDLGIGAPSMYLLYGERCSDFRRTNTRILKRLISSLTDSITSELGVY